MHTHMHTHIHPYIHTYMYFCWFNFDALQRETLINPQRNIWIIVDPAGIELTTCRLRQHHQLPVGQHDRFMPSKLCEKSQSQGCTGQLTHTHTHAHTHTHTYIPEPRGSWKLTHTGDEIDICAYICIIYIYIYIYIYIGLIFHALAQGNAHKTTKELDWMGDFSGPDLTLVFLNWTDFNSTSESLEICFLG